jgi:hypothetical protein
MAVAPTLQIMIEQIKAVTGQPVVDETHKPTANERNNIVHLCFKYTLGIQFRMADLSIIEMMASDIRSMEELRETYIPTVAEYMWDHFMGEPDEPSLELVEQFCHAITDYFFTLSEETRKDINSYTEDEPQKM